MGLATVAVLALAALWLAPTASAADGAISGEVTRASGGSAVLGVEVCAEAVVEPFARECDLTAADGSYEIVGLAPGNYVVSFEPGESNPFLVFQLYNGVVRYQDATKINIDGSGTTKTGVDAALIGGGVVEGKVLDAINSAPLGGVEVCARWEEGGPFFSCDLSAGNGSFRIVGVHPGLNEIEFWPLTGHEPEFFPAISIAAGATVNSEAHLVRQEGRISGNVYTAASHAPLGGITVCAIWAEFQETGGCALTSASGAYEFFPVPPGQFKVVFSPMPAEVEFNPEAKPDIWPTQYWNQKPTFAAADTLTVTRTSAFAGIDGLLGTVPSPPASSGGSGGGSSTPPATVTPTPVTVSPPKPLRCPKGKVKKTVKGKASCVKRHKRHHRRHHRHRPHR